jgi:hypothetical protein
LPALFDGNSGKVGRGKGLPRYNSPPGPPGSPGLSAGTPVAGDSRPVVRRWPVMVRCGNTLH